MQLFEHFYVQNLLIWDRLYYLECALKVTYRNSELKKWTEIPDNSRFIRHRHLAYKTKNKMRSVILLTHAFFSNNK